MRGAALVALTAAIGNFLQGWDSATIAGAMVYIKKDMNLQTSVEGLVVAMSLIGATAITTCSGPMSDWLGRRPMLIFSSILYFISGSIMLWSPNVCILCFARLLDGFGIGLAIALVPVYISETSPAEIRGLLNTLPQFTGSGGMFISYCMVFGMSLSASPSWRMMLGVLSIPSLLYFGFAVFYLPESPRWLVSKGRILEAKQVLQRLRGIEDVSGELVLLVEGLGIGGEKSIEEYIIGPADDNGFDEFLEPNVKNDGVRLYGTQEGLSWIARPVQGQSSIGIRSHHGSLANQSVPLMDQLVPLFSGVHEKLPETGGGSMRSTLIPNFGDMKSQHKDENHYTSDDNTGEDSDNDLCSPLISCQTTSMDKDMASHPINGDALSMRWHIKGNGEARSCMRIGDEGEIISYGQLSKKSELIFASEWTEREEEAGFKRIYLHEETLPGSRHGSIISLPDGNNATGESEYVLVAALVSQPALCSKSLIDQHPMGPAMVHPSETVSKGPVWSALLDPGVKRALIVGIGIQIGQQFSGINGVLYYTPQILEEAGVDVLLSDMGLSSVSASFLISALTSLLMLPCIVVAMRLMDVSGRRWLLLATLPVLIASLVVLVISEVLYISSVVNAAISTACVVIYFCSFVMGFGPVPNILCSEIFPTRVRGLCIAICAMAYWIADIIVTYTLPVILSSIGLVGIFSIYAAMCIISWVFVFLKVPETKGMPLDVISEFFAVGGSCQG